jgi:hypothetical protein
LAYQTTGSRSEFLFLFRLFKLNLSSQHALAGGWTVAQRQHIDSLQISYSILFVTKA